MNCSIEGCEGKSRARAMCLKHYYRVKRTGLPIVFKRALSAGRLCDKEGCGNPHKARGLCLNHYERWRLANLPEMRRRRRIRSRLWVQFNRKRKRQLLRDYRARKSSAHPQSEAGIPRVLPG